MEVGCLTSLGALQFPAFPLAVPQKRLTEVDDGRAEVHKSTCLAWMDEIRSSVQQGNVFLLPNVVGKGKANEGVEGRHLLSSPRFPASDFLTWQRLSGCGDDDFNVCQASFRNSDAD